MNKKPRVSIIIAACNQLAYMKLALRSIIENTYVPLEFVIVDNGSKPSVKKYFDLLTTAHPIRYIRNETNRGPITAVNQGIRESTADYLCVIHNDLIILEQGWLKKIIGVMDRDPHIGIVGLAGRKEIYKNGCVNEASLKHNLQNEDLNEPMREKAAEVAVIDGMCFLFKKALLRKIHGLDETYGYMHCYDLDISMQSIAAGFKNVVVNIEAMHIGNGGITRKTGAYKQIVKDDYGLLKKNCKIFARKWARLLPLHIDKYRKYRNSCLTKVII